MLLSIKSITAKPKVSVVIPAYNEAEHISDCLKALKKQNVRPYEIIVVDNNSSDDTAKIAEKFSGVKVIKEIIQGRIAASKAGFDSARGDIIARVDADSMPDSDWVGQIIQALNDQKVAASTGPLYYHDMPLPKVNQQFDSFVRRSLKGVKDLEFLAGANMAIKVEDWRMIREELCSGMDIHEDIDIALHLNDHGRGIVYNEKQIVGSSTEMMSEPPHKFYKYVQKWKTTYQRHGRNASPALVPMAVLWAIYPPLKMIRFFYDPTTSRFSFKKLRLEIDRILNIPTS